MNNQTRKHATKRITNGAIVAAMYVALTYLSAFAGLSSGAIQLRLSEMLCILPIFFGEAISGLWIGCFLANLLTGCAVWDIIFGSLATLIGALGAYLLRNIGEKLKWVATLPTVLANAFIVPGVFILAYGATDAYFLLVLTIGLGELLSAGIGGYALYYMLKKSGANKLFR